MATKTISLELDAYERLKAAKRPGESFSATVRRARFGPSDSTGKTILASMGELTVRPADLEAVEYWSSGVEKARTTTPSRWGSRA
ncbi:MAG: antitoxin VapB family protein [Spirochaetaceae bacterium]|nr:antitoxin VapB family protein [Spirochaetaceae bacterium]